uniref:Vesicle-associated membrane 1-3-like protein n=1 Tax=Triticum monococcum TaxID=4568 RepID=A0A060AIU4_TRIMO|nr:vesicle-associated membrane 1-3-like protein [Triticum monococcum]
MSAGSASFLEIQPSELAFPFELMKQSSCSMQLTNKTDHYVAFKVKTTNPKQYCVRPNIGVVLPGSTCDVTVTMQAQREAPPDLQCKDKFLVQSVAAENGAATQDISAAMFNKEPGKVVDECKLRVIYVPTSSPSPFSEESEQGSSARSLENGTPNSTLPQSVFRSSGEASKEKSSEATSMISKLTEEKMSAVQQNQKLRQELDVLRKESSKSNGGFSITFLIVVGILGIIAGFILKKT